MPVKMESPDSLVSSSLKMSVGEFVQLTEHIGDLLHNESGNVGNLKITGRLVEAPPESEAIVIGDLHGDLDSLKQILKTTNFLQKSQDGKQPLLIFLGDYGDRGIYSPEVYYIVLNLKMEFPENVILLRGNHEGPDDLLAHPHDLPSHLKNRFGDKWSNAYLKLKELFGHLYNAVVVRGTCVMLHGGVPSQAKSVDDLINAHLKHPLETHLEEILWSDPEENIKGTYPSPRGAGKLFGKGVTLDFLRMLSVNFLIRGHEPSDKGFRINHSGRILTLFSRKGEPYFNSEGAFLRFDMTSIVKDASQLQCFVRPL